MDFLTTLPASHFLLNPWPSCLPSLPLVCREAWERKEYWLCSYPDLGPVSDLIPIRVTLINLLDPCSLSFCIY